MDQILVYTAEGHPIEVKVELDLVRKALQESGAGQIDELPDMDAASAWLDRQAGQVFTARLGAPVAALADLIPRLPQEFPMRPLAIDAANGVLVVSYPVSRIARSRRVAGWPACCG